MSRIFVFGIGGTGSRVIKSLTMLCAAGAKLNGYDIVPILIDPHKDLPELKECKKLLDIYAKIQKEAYLNFTPNTQTHFFSTKIRSLGDIATQVNSGFDFDERIDESFGDYIAYNTLPNGSPNKDLIDLLYSEQTLKTSLSVGFKGNPNIGTVVLNRFDELSWYNAFESIFSSGDKIFIISSIFGGTGAAGFPLLLKKLRDSSNNEVKNAVIGALPVMPYFKLTDPDSNNPHQEIDSNNFFTKTKAALSYYEKHLKGLNAMYYLADPHEQTNGYKNDEQNQNNKAHLVEFIGASAITHFANTQIELGAENFFHYSLSEDANRIDFSNLGDELRNEVYEALTNYYIFTQIHPNIKGQSDAPVVKNEKFDDVFFKNDFIRDVEDFNNRYVRWLSELSENDRQFRPFNLVSGSDDFHRLIVKGELKDKNLFGFKNVFNTSNYMVQMETSRKVFSNIPSNAKSTKYLTLASTAIQEVNKQKFNY